MAMTPARRETRHNLEVLQEEINELLGTPFGRFPIVERELFAPSIDMWDDDENIYVESDMPGLSPKDISVSVNGDTLSISAKKEEKKQEKERKNVYRSERYLGSMYRQVLLPASVDTSKVKASYRDGVLLITLPKTQKEKEKEVKIPVAEK